MDSLYVQEIAVLLIWAVSGVYFTRRNFYGSKLKLRRPLVTRVTDASY